MTQTRDGIPVVSTIHAADWTVAPWYAEAFLDRGKKGKEPKLVLARSGPQGMLMMADSATIERPGNTLWPGFFDRPSAVILAGKLAIWGESPFAMHTGFSTRHDMWLWVRELTADRGRAWGREAAAGMDLGHMWFGASSVFAIPKSIAQLPKLRDVLADPPDGMSKDAVEALHQAWGTVRADKQGDARYMGVLAFDALAASGHLRLHIVDDIRTAISLAVQSETHARTFNNGILSDLVPTPIWCGKAAFA